MWLHAPNITCRHGFSTRYGGVSPAPYGTLNLGGHEDDNANIEHNRNQALKALNISPQALSTLKQVHGKHVCMASGERQEGDALISNKPGDVLAVSVADCYPILFQDQERGIIGAAHAGWRGTVLRIVAETLIAMEDLGARRENIQVAIGQGISQNKFVVGSEVIKQFSDAGFNKDCWAENRIDLVKCNIFALQECGVPAKNIWAMNRCTYEDDFFSYRRDNGITGRMWGLIALL